MKIALKTLNNRIQKTDFLTNWLEIKQNRPKVGVAFGAAKVIGTAPHFQQDLRHMIGFVGNAAGLCEKFNNLARRAERGINVALLKYH